MSKTEKKKNLELAIETHLVTWKLKELRDERGCTWSIELKGDRNEVKECFITVVQSLSH